MDIDLHYPKWDTETFSRLSEACDTYGHNINIKNADDTYNYISHYVSSHYDINLRSNLYNNATTVIDRIFLESIFNHNRKYGAFPTESYLKQRAANTINHRLTLNVQDKRIEDHPDFFKFIPKPIYHR